MPSPIACYVLPGLLWIYRVGNNATISPRLSYTYFVASSKYTQDLIGCCCLPALHSWQHVNQTPIESCLRGKHSLWYITRFVNACHWRLPYLQRYLGLSEEQITDIFNDVGKVLNFRLVYDRDTGRPKGFGFAEYPDAGMSLRVTNAKKRSRLAHTCLPLL